MRRISEKFSFSKLTVVVMYSTTKDIVGKRFIKFRKKTELMKTFPVEFAKREFFWNFYRSNKTNEEESLT